ncbi:sulfite exporter TauE/SafE family protein [Campylobacter blaseri]|uniref:Probable membrane transporter protein n=1 Tax=Campylobacter blaseri TaxID=2042961 RepID=A0A2P8R2A8_9BACT|nr:TSUP family transporter [Campylobacter blaseri]PSM52622.1 hypothetical protein CQ405_02515 [Campylobacter blaseri]PSM54270.1 hypothetical protein CRN67_02515 [Campylobacter blaseri]QKF85921.1 sulfite exporter TauE/SafE family protein [Campylobacter blaseri]
MEFEIWQFAVFFIVAFIGGFIDAIAGGGGLICLPILMMMGVPAHTALATNKLQGSFGTLSATINFALKGYIDFKEIFSGIVFTFIGACLGTTLILFLDASFLNYLIPILLFIIFVYTIFSPNLGEIEKEAKMNAKLFYIVFGLILGFYDGFFGPGTGSFWMFVFIGLMGFAMKKAVACTKVLNFTSNIVSLAVFIVGGHILWAVGLLMGVGQILGGYVGSNFVINKDVKYIRIIFLTMVGLTILKLIYDLI